VSSYTSGSNVAAADELTLLSLSDVLIGPLWVWTFIAEAFLYLYLIRGVILLMAMSGNALTELKRQLIPII